MSVLAVRPFTVLPAADVCAASDGKIAGRIRSYSHTISAVKCLLQIPRLYAVYKEQGIIETFEQMLDNIFTPLFEVTKDPTSHPQLHLFLKQVGLQANSIAPRHCGKSCSQMHAVRSARVLGFGGPCSRRM